ncbi:hypothetical protein PIB30_115558, partial [Stylosanthes scabra]|nr:hypothetical protein [Stylosanthes scabra]
MARKGKEVARAIPYYKARSWSSHRASRYCTETYDSEEHYERSQLIVDRDVLPERTVQFPDEE